MLDVIIVDDEPTARRTLRECCVREPDLRIIGEYGDSRTALEAIRSQPPHLLFLDIQIDSLNGMGIARALDPQNLPLIVFVTAYDQYAIEAFEVSAVDYLLKPFDDDRFRKTLERVRRRKDADGHSERQATLTAVLAQIEKTVRAPLESRPRILAESGSRMHMLDVAQIELREAHRRPRDIRRPRYFAVGGEVAAVAADVANQPLLCREHQSHP
jgi:two-component system LytT family response regulator